MAIYENSYFNPEYSGACFSVNGDGVLEITNARPNCKQFANKRELKQWLRQQFRLVVEYNPWGYTRKDYSRFYDYLENLPFHCCVSDYQYDSRELLGLL